MKIAVFSAHRFEKSFLEAANQALGYELVYFDTHLDEKTAVLAQGFTAVSCFVTDRLNAVVLKNLAKQKVRLVSLRSAGFNHVDLQAAKHYQITVTRVPAYSPYAVAEFAVGLMLALNRKIHRAYARTHEGNFLLDGLLGFDLHGKTVGIIGTGKIGSVLAQIMHGFGCYLLGHDPVPTVACEKLGLQYVTLTELYQKSDIISLHCPLTPQTHYLINAAAIEQMKTGVMLINTGRGALIHTHDMITALKNGKIGYLGMDVYEEEENLFFQDLSNGIIQDDVFARLLTFPNVIVTGHQAFFTNEALINIARISLNTIKAYLENNLDPAVVVHS